MAVFIPLSQIVKGVFQGHFFPCQDKVDPVVTHTAQKLYGNTAGCPNGITLILLVAQTCILSPQNDLAVQLDNFFCLYAQWSGPFEVSLVAA